MQITSPTNVDELLMFENAIINKITHKSCFQN